MNFNCDIFYLQRDVPLQILEAITTDVGQNVLITRFFHNKVVFYSVNFSKCYFKFFDPVFLFSFLSYLGLPLFVIGIWDLINKRKEKLAKILILWLLISPVVYIFKIFPQELNILLVRTTLYIIALCGLLKAYRRVREVLRR